MLASLWLGWVLACPGLVWLEPGAAETAIGGRVEVWLDSAATATAPALCGPASPAQFTPSDQEVPGFGFSDATLWLRFTLANPDSLALTAWLEVAFPLLDDVRLYDTEAPHEALFTVGDRLPFAERPLAHRNFLLPVRMAADGRRTLLLRVRSSTALQVPLHVWRAELLTAGTARDSIGLGMYYGALLIMVLYVLGLAISLRQGMYLWYVAFGLAFGVCDMALRGLAYQFLWPQLPVWNGVAIPLSAGLASLLMNRFAASFLGTARYPGLHRTLRAFALLCGLLVCATPVVSYRVIVVPTVLLAIANALAVFAVGVAVYLRGYTPARLYLAGWSVFLLGIVLLCCNRLGVVDRSFLTDHAMQLGSLLQMALLALALADRFHILERERRQLADALEERNVELWKEAEHHRDTARALATARDTLELRVKTRTAELEVANEELKLARDRAQESAAVRTRFLATMSHEVRTPMNGIIGMAELLSEGELSRKQRQYVRVVRTSGEALLAIVNDILDYEKIESGAMPLVVEATVLRDVVEDVFDIQAVRATERRIELIYDLGADLPYAVRTDRNRVRQVLSNLVSNAIKFSRDAAVLVEVTSGGSDGRTVDFAVSDRGVGLLERAQTAVIRLVPLAGRNGAAEAEGVQLLEKPIKHSQLYNTLTALLCSAARKVPSQRVSTVVRLADTISLRILVAEDNKFNRLFIRELLARMGYTPCLAENGSQALARAKEEAFDLVLMDMQMPVMDGVEATRRILAEVPSPPTIIAMSANVLAEERQRCLDAGMVDFVTKPFRPKNVQRIIETWSGSGTAPSVEVGRAGGQT